MLKKTSMALFYFEHFSRNMEPWHQNVEKLLARLSTDCLLAVHEQCAFDVQVRR
jgi:hypothetical protein